MLILGLGSNIGARASYLRQAIRSLRGAWVFKEPPLCSSVYESEALLPEDAPEDWNVPFFNMVVAGKTTQPPEELLEHVKAIEKFLGREDRGRWGPREIDIDILALEKCTIDLSHLKVPHPAMMERDFVLMPLAEILPEWRYPSAGHHQGKTAQARLEELRQHYTTTARKVGPLEVL